jgi:hypothetical protein
MFRDNPLGGNAARNLPPLHSPLDEQLPIRLREHVRRLRLILPVISVTVLALRRQNAELDEDIACVLHQHACDPLDLEIDDVDEMIESLAAAGRTKGVTQ